MSSLRSFASAVVGAAAGLTAAGTVIAGAPVVGRTPAAGFAPMATRDAAVDQARGPLVPPMAAVLAPAMAAGVVEPPDPEADRP